MTHPCIGSPNNLDILLHHYCSSAPHERESAPAVVEGHRFLINELMIKSTPTPGVYEVTDKGRTFIEHLMKVPFPVQKWEVPNEHPDHYELKYEVHWRFP